MNRLLSELLPLRTTAILGDFAEAKVLPHRFGDLRRTRFPLIKLSPTNWFAADHAMRITNVYVDDEATVGYDVVLDGDDNGNAWTVVRLAAPAAPDVEVSASGVGRLNPRTGELLQNPAEIIEFILALAGRTETFPLLRAECAAADIVLAGSLDRSQTIRAWVDEIAYSCGAIWTPTDATLYPTANVRGQITSLDRYAARDVQVTSTLPDTADVLHVSYDVNDATERPQQFIELTASPQRFGGIAVEVELRWLRSSANAETIGRRMLARMAGIRYSITFTTDQVAMRPCRWTRLESHPQWPIAGADPTPMVLSVDVDTLAKRSTVTAEYVASAPAITVTAHSVALPTTVTAAVAVALANGVATFTISDDAGKPIRDARCTFDGGAAKKTNEQGRVEFSVTAADPPKKHALAVSALGFTPFVLDVFL